MIRLLVLFGIIFYITGCSTRGLRYHENYTSRVNASHVRIYKHYHKATMRPYVVRGRVYYPTVVKVGETFDGISSWYGPNFNGRLTSNGEVYNMYGLTAANKILPMNTIVKVTNKKNGRSVVVRINDRGPFVNNRIIDLSKAAALKINMVGTGTAPIRLKILGFAGKGTITIPQYAELHRGPKIKILTKFAIQIGAFINYDGAFKIQTLYNHKNGYLTIIKDINVNGHRMFKVWLTGFKSETEARDYKSHHFTRDAFIVQE